MCCLAVFTLHQLGNHDKLNDLLYGPLPKFFKRLLTPGLGKQGKFEWAEQQNTLTHRAFPPLWPSWLNHIPATSMAGWSRTISHIRRWTRGSLRNVLDVLFSHSVSPHPDQRRSCGWEVSEHKKSKSPSRSRSQPCYTHWPYSWDTHESFWSKGSLEVKVQSQDRAWHCSHTVVNMFHFLTHAINNSSLTKWILISLDFSKGVGNSQTFWPGR